MSDVTPDYDLSQQQLRYQIAEQTMAIERNRLAVIELLARTRRNNTNIEAAGVAIEQLKIETPTTATAKQKVKSQIAAQVATIERQKLENLEAKERAQLHSEQMLTAVKARNEYGEQLNSLEETHGKLDYEEITQSLMEMSDG